MFYRTLPQGGLWDCMRSLKRDGVIRHLGLSSHAPDIVRRFLDTGRDMLIFSIHPAYDYSTEDYGICRWTTAQCKNLSIETGSTYGGGSSIFSLK